jgi:hypothetical protein
MAGTLRDTTLRCQRIYQRTTARAREARPNLDGPNFSFIRPCGKDREGPVQRRAFYMSAAVIGFADTVWTPGRAATEQQSLTI